MGFILGIWNGDFKWGFLQGYVGDLFWDFYIGLFIWVYNGVLTKAIKMGILKGGYQMGKLNWD